MRINNDGNQSAGGDRRIIQTQQSQLQPGMSRDNREQQHPRDDEQ